MISEAAQKEIEALKLQHPGKRVMLIAEKGTMGVGSSRMSGVNNVALWTGQQASPYVPFVNIAPVVAGTNGISPIFLTTVGVTGGIGVDLKNWVKKVDEDGKPILNNDGNPILEQKYSVETGTVLTINTKEKKLYSADGGEELVDMAGFLHATEARIHEGRRLLCHRLRQEAAEHLPPKTLGVEPTPVFAPFQDRDQAGPGPDRGREDLQPQRRGRARGARSCMPAPMPA